MASYNKTKFQHLIDDLFKVHFEELKEWKFDPHIETQLSYQQRWVKSQNIVKQNLMQYFGILDRNYRKLIENFDRGNVAEKGSKGIAESNNIKGDQIFNDDSSYKEGQSKFGRRSSVGSVSGNSVDNIGAAPSHLVHPRLKASKPIYTSMV